MMKFNNIEQKPLLLVTVDTEEAFDWNATFCKIEYNIDNLFIYHKKFQDFYQRHHVQTILAVSYPLLDDDKSVELLKEIFSKKLALSAIHLHPWVTPPHKETRNAFNSYAGNLPFELEEQKIITMCEIFEARLGIRPKIYKAGRYGIGKNTSKILEKLGFEYDLSYLSGRNFSYDGGPDQRHITDEYFKTNNITHIPVTGGFLGDFSHIKFLQNLVLKEKIGFLKVRGLLSRLRWCEFINLTPENMPLEEMELLTQDLYQKGREIFQLSFHSSSFLAGYLPHAQTEEDVIKLEEKIKKYILFFSEKIACKI